MIELGPQVPQRGNRFSRWLGTTLLRLMGWRILGSMPNLPRVILIGAPHTSNMDGVIGLGALMAMGLDARTMIKDSAFKGPLGVFLRWMGALPIRRGSRDGVVGQSIAALQNSEKLWLLIAPEGTRKASAQFKQGFHRIALGAGVPIVAAAANYRDRTISLSPARQPSEDYDADLEYFVDFLHREGSPRHPERLSQPLCLRAGQPWRGEGGS